MALPGRTPKDDDRKVNRNPLAHEWIEVIDEPYAGKKPALPKALPKETQAWWRVVSRMPHCVLWTADDWQYALDTALVHGRFIEGGRGSDAELRRRGDQLGITWSARRNLRIRYVKPESEVEERPEDQVSDFEAERRRRLMSAV